VNRPYELSLRDVVGILRRRRTFIVRTLAVMVALGAIVSLVHRPAYRAVTTITADKTPPVILLDQPGLVGQNVGSPVGVASPDVPTLIALARSDAVRNGAAAALVATTGVPAAQAILKTLRAQPFWNTDIVRITVDDSNPVVAAEGANAVTASLINMDLTARRRWARDMRESVQQQLAIADPRLQAAEDALVASKAQNGDVPLSQATVTSLDRLAQLEAQRLDVRTQQEEVKARIDAARTLLASQAQIAPTQWKPSPLIVTLQTDLADEEIELSGLRRQFTPKYPAVVSVLAKIEETKGKLDAELARNLQIDQYGVNPVYQQLAQQLRQDEVSSAALDARDRALTAAIAQYEGTMRNLPVRELAQARLTRNVKEAEAIHQLLTDKLQQTLVAEASIGSVIRVIDAAQPPKAPVRPRSLSLLIGAIFGAALGVGGALIKEHIEDPVKSVEHGRALGLSVLGAIPQLSSWDAHGSGDAPGVRTATLWESLFPARTSAPNGLVAADRWHAAFAESFRYLRTNLLCLNTKPLRTVLVTSPGTGEGKDIVAANLAIALAQTGQRVWLVDCDLRRPALAQALAFQHFGQGARAGLAELLGKGVPDGQLILPTAVENLRFLPAGTPPPNPAELLGSQRMRAFLQQDRDDVDILVLAAPPILPVTDAAVLAPAVGGVLLVAHIGTTPCAAARMARRQLETVRAQMLGTVLTGVSMDRDGSYFNGYARHYGAEPYAAWYFGPDRQKRVGGLTPSLVIALRALGGRMLAVRGHVGARYRSAARNASAQLASTRAAMHARSADHTGQQTSPSPSGTRALLRSISRRLDG
jgi:capsular exopolysaccharide synthesis family protein